MKQHIDRFSGPEDLDQFVKDLHQSMLDASLPVTENTAKSVVARLTGNTSYANVVDSLNYRMAESEEPDR